MSVLRMVGCLMLVVGGLMASAQAAENKTYPAPKNLGDPAKLGVGIQRTMTLLASSTPEHRNSVKVLFYGQSITEQDWWKPVAADLKRRFPNANLVIENRALGGFASQRLVKTAETDLYPFYPDLLIFYVYGSHKDYEDIIRRTRERTTVDILIQTDHVTKDSDLTEETDPAKLRPDGKIWNQFMNYLFLPGVVKQYGTGVVDQRNLWKDYLRQAGLPAKALLRDGVHLNAHGCYVMSEMVKAALVKRADSKIDPMNCDTVRTLAVGKDAQWANGKLTVEFEGNRIDAIVKEGAAAPARVTIDGKRPSEFPELYALTRALPKPGGKWPPVTMIKSKLLPLVEDWTMDVTKDQTDAKVWTFTVSGSKTGPDGSGRSDAAFVSKSGRVAIEKENWDVDFALSTLAGLKPVPEKFTVRWKVAAWFVDEFVSPGVKDKTVETVVTLAQGLSNGKHTLVIEGGVGMPIGAIRVYRPTLGRQ